jgi:chromosome segregation ATPase
MSKAETVADAITRIVKQNELLTYAAELLKTFGSLENAVTEKERQVEQIKASYEQLKTEHDAFETALIEAKSSALAELNAAKQEAKDVVAKAKAKAKDLDEQADEIYRARVDEANSAALNQVSEHESRLKGLREVILEKEAHIASLDTAIVEATKEVDTLEKKLEKVRENIAKLAAA